MATETLPKLIRPFLLAIPAAGLGLGFALRLSGHAEWSNPVWAAATLPVLLALRTLSGSNR